VKGILDRIRSGLQVPRYIEGLILALLCAVFCAELWFSVGQLSQTADEATHLYSGYRYLVCSDLTVSPEHPPLAKVVAALPVLAMNFATDCAPFKGGDSDQAIASLNWLYSQNWTAALHRARMAVSVFALGLCLLVWIFARRMFDLPTAVLATLLLIFEPNVLAFGPLVMTDVPVTCMMLFAVYAFYRWASERTAPFLLLTGLATGLTLLAKHSGVLILPILFVLAVVDAMINPRSQTTIAWAVFSNLRAVALLCVIAVAIVWAGYGMHFAAHPGSVQFPEPPAYPTSLSARVLLTLKHYHAFPEAYLEGFAAAVAISKDAGPEFVAGKIHLSTPWYSVPFYMLIRSTSAAIVLFALALGGAAVVIRKRRREFLFLSVPMAIFLAVCVRSSMTGGVRYLLPIFPFLLIATAAGCIELMRRANWVGYIVTGLVILHAASSLHACPNYLSYANEFWGGPQNSYKYLGWLDLGQAYPEAKTYLEKHSNQDCWFFTDWQWDPKLYGIPCQTIGSYLQTELPPRIRGTVVVSATLLNGTGLVQQGLAAPFQNLTPSNELGGSALLVYEGAFDTKSAASMSEVTLSRQALMAGQTVTAMMHANRAIEFAPENAYARAYMCLLLTDMGQTEAAIRECSRAKSILLQDPLRDEPQRKNVLETVEVRLSRLGQQP
jgi:hypothetical protein